MECGITGAATQERILTQSIEAFKKQEREVAVLERELRRLGVSEEVIEKAGEKEKRLLKRVRENKQGRGGWWVKNVQKEMAAARREGKRTSATCCKEEEEEDENEEESEREEVFANQEKINNEKKKKSICEQGGYNNNGSNVLLPPAVKREEQETKEEDNDWTRIFNHPNILRDFSTSSSLSTPGFSGPFHPFPFQTSNHSPLQRQRHENLSSCPLSLVLLSLDGTVLDANTSLLLSLGCRHKDLLVGSHVTQHLVTASCDIIARDLALVRSRVGCVQPQVHVQAESAASLQENAAAKEQQSGVSDSTWPFVTPAYPSENARFVVRQSSYQTPSNNCNSFAAQAPHPTQPQTAIWTQNSEPSTLPSSSSRDAWCARSHARACQVWRRRATAVRKQDGDLVNMVGMCCVVVSGEAEAGRGEKQTPLGTLNVCAIQ